MDKVSYLLGYGEDLTALQMSLRAAIALVYTLILVRIGGVRIFGRRSSVDTIVLIVMGSVLARGIVGASPLLSTLAAAATMIIMHRILTWLSFKSKKIESLIKGECTVLYQNGQIKKQNLAKTGLTENDLFESLRLETRHSTLANISIAYIETNGRISFIEK